jgi:hypothetical protein
MALAAWAFDSFDVTITHPHAVTILELRSLMRHRWRNALQYASYMPYRCIDSGWQAAAGTSTWNRFNLSQLPTNTHQ